MKQFMRIREKALGFMDTMNRFPLTIFLLFIAVLTYIAIINGDDQPRLSYLLISLLLGASIYSVFQLVYESFFSQRKQRFLLMGITILLSFLYYLVIQQIDWKIDTVIRTTVIFFLLLVLFLWIPSIKSGINFNQSFMAVFKAFFTSVFFQGVLFLGVAIILAAVDGLITPVNEKAYLYAAIIIFVLLAPFHFLTNIPLYSRSKFKKEEKTTGIHEENTNEEEAISGEVIAKEANIEETIVKEANSKEVNMKKMDSKEMIAEESNYVYNSQDLLRLTSPTKFLEALVSYVFIPITSVFTIILLIYILMNITGDFWKDNLMEPLLVSYSIIVLIVYLLASTMSNAFSKYFRMIFPKILIPVVLFQTIASVLKIEEVGVTYGRYYVIMFGVFATVVGILFSIKPVEKNGLIAPILIALSVISILPFTNAFTISRISQVNRLVNVLEQNNMLVNDIIVPNSSVSEKHRKIIVSAVDYLDQMGDSKEIIWLNQYSKTHNFAETFGFDPYGQVQNNSEYVMIIRDTSEPIPIEGYDFMASTFVYSYNTEEVTYQFEKNGLEYSLQVKQNASPILVVYQGNTEINRFELKEIFQKYEGNIQESMVDTKDLTYTKENELSAITVVANNININVWGDRRDEQAEIYILVDIK